MKTKNVSRLTIQATILAISISISASLRVEANQNSDPIFYIPPYDQNEGGELQLIGASGNPNWVLDTISDRFRIFHSRTTIPSLEISSQTGYVGVGVWNPIRLLSVAGGIDVKGPVGFFLDEGRLVVPSETEIVADPTADGGRALCRRASAAGGNMWYGPYDMIQPGNYLVQFRMKVSSNQSNADLLWINVSTESGGKLLASKTIKASDFRHTDEWQLFTFPITISGAASALEVRGLGFVANITDVYLDYINIVAGDSRGFYSGEFTITPAGYVGIKTDAPTHPLSVNGAIRAKEVIVDTGWADDVFEPGYNLISIDAMARHISENKRLPGVPSAKEVSEKGVSVGETQAILLRKIEEMSLYIIKQDKRMQELEQEVSVLRASIK